MHNGVLALYIQVLFRKLVVGQHQSRYHAARQTDATYLCGRNDMF